MKTIKGLKLAVLVTACTFGTAMAGDYDGIAEAEDFVDGVPANPTDAWVLASGGRMYDNWWEALGGDAPEGTHSAYPAASSKSGETTWRCKECHGWDYRGAEGIYSGGSHFTGIKGISGAIGMDESEIASMLRGDVHGYSSDMIGDDALARLAAFVSRGQVDMSLYVDLTTREVIAGNIDRGRAIFQTVCSACHGFDGRLLDWGDSGDPAYVGTEAVAAPDEVFNKIMNAHPGVEMVNLRAFGADAAHDVLTYVATQPTE